MRLWPFGRKKPSEQPRTAADIERLAAAGGLADAVVTPPPAPRASAARIGAPLASLPERPLGATAAPVAGAVDRPAVAAVLVLDEVQRVTVDGPGVIGRDPSRSAPVPEPGSAAMPRRAVTLDDPDKLLSRTHLEFGFGDDATFWVLDARSANGAELRRPGFPAVRLVPGQRTAVTPADVVVFGGHTLRAEPAVSLQGESRV